MAASVSRSFRVHYLVTVAASLMLAGCSASVERFAQSSESSSNPSDADPVYTASVPKQKAAASSGDEETVTSRPLTGSSLKKPTYSYSYNENNSTSYKQPTYKVPQVAENAPPAAPQNGSVTVGPGMTLYSIARSNNLTVAELAAANRLKPPYAVRQGQVLRVPGVAEAVTPAVPARPAVAASEPVVPRKSAGSHQVTQGDTLFSLGRTYGVSPYAIADLNGISHDATLSLGQQLRIPGSGAVAAKPDKSAATEEIADSKPLVDEETDTASQADEEPAKTAEIPPAEPEAQPKQIAEPQLAPPADPAASTMRWPVRGKVISAFGTKPGGLKNEGINIAVPEGTSIRAAENGVVAYAGNELKGYGNLVLIRHDGGWVTAYAHSKELFVKRGDTVKRGDVIAKAGQTGSVSSPQLHFEVRKGATAMDPLKFLSSATAAN